MTKASVTLVFDNSNASMSPHGYEQYAQITVTRQIVIGGRNKYMINGHNAQLQRVQNLFHSVQLNVNNPHFLIMQGRITKVLNMKPIETLGMIEEAAGTRMFEMKKQQAIKTIEKKETKLAEIKRIIDDDITPRLQKLGAERTQYLEFTTMSNEVESLARCAAARSPEPGAQPQHPPLPLGPPWVQVIDRRENAPRGVLPIAVPAVVPAGAIARKLQVLVVRKPP